MDLAVAYAHFAAVVLLYDGATGTEDEQDPDAGDGRDPHDNSLSRTL